SAPPNVVGERLQGQLLGDLGLADERARAAPADEVALADEPVESGAHGQPGDAEVGAQLSLGRDRLADPQLLDEIEHLVARLALFRHLVKTTSSRMAASRGASAARRLVPVFGSKKWKRCGSTASRRRLPIAALVRGSTRALKSAFSSTMRVASSALASSASEVIRGASTWKNAWTSEPSSSSTSTSTSIRGISGGANVASSKLS